MKPLTHPAINNISVEGILHALSDPVRVAIYAQLASSGGSATCTDLAAVSNSPIPKSTLSQHFRALREAGLIFSERHGVEMRNTSRCQEIEQRFPGLLPAILQAHCVQSKERARTPKKKSAGRNA